MAECGLRPSRKASPPSVAPLLKITVWFAALSVVGAYGLGGLAGIATDFALKDRLGLGPEGMARYTAILALPSYAAFLFGYTRDRWAARVGGDRGLAALGAGGVVLAHAFLGSAEPTYGRLLGAMIFSGIASSYLGTALNGAIVRFSSERGVTDRWSAFAFALGTLISALSGVTAGWAAEHVAYRPLLALTALRGLAYVGLLFLAPRGTFLPPSPEAERSKGRSVAAAFVALVRSRAFVAALGLAFAYNFGSASGSSFFYYMTDRQGVGPELFGRYNAIFNLAPLPVALLYGAFARRTSLRNWLAVGMSMVFAGTFLYFTLQHKAYLVRIGANLKGRTDYRQDPYRGYAADGKPGATWYDDEGWHTLLFRPDFDFQDWGHPSYW